VDEEKEIVSSAEFLCHFCHGQVMKGHQNLLYGKKQSSLRIKDPLEPNFKISEKSQM
jgi:hypothetical protein